MQKTDSARSANIFLLFVVIVYFGFNYLIGYLSGYMGEKFYEENIYYFILLSQVLGILIPVIIYTSIRKKAYQKEYRLERLRIGHILMIVVMAPLVMLIAASISGIWNYLFGFNIQDIQMDIPIPKDNNELLLMLLIIGLTPAVCEEFLCRGVLLNGYEKFGSMKAILVSGFLFSILHFDIRVLGSIFFMGIIIGYYVVRTNSIFAGILAHFLNNALASLQRYYFRDLMANNNLTLDRNAFYTYLIVLIVSLCIFIPILTGFWYITKGTAENSYKANTKTTAVSRTILHWPIIIIIVLYGVYQAVFVF